MSYLTDRYREQAKAAKGRTDDPVVPGQMFDDVVKALPLQRRTVLRGGFGASLTALFGGSLLAACGGGEDAYVARSEGAMAFGKIGATTGDRVVVPADYTVDVLFSAGDAVAGTVAYTGTYLRSSDTEKVAGGNHDGMHYYAIPGVDPNRGGLLAINHEAPDAAILLSGSYDAATADPEAKKIVLSSVGVSVIEIERKDGQWQVKAGSRYNRRYTGNTAYAVGGPAKPVVGPKVTGTLNNCASGRTPWGTYLTCEETTDNYLDPTQPENGYGWVVEIDPLGELGPLPVKRTALGRFDHENTAYLLGQDNTLAIYMGDDSTPGCVYKFVPDRQYNARSRAANVNLLDSGTLYAAKFNADGTGQWIELTQGKNGLVVGATDPGLDTQSNPAQHVDKTIDFATQADVVINAKAAARVVGATLMDRPEWITVAPDKRIYLTLTNNSSRAVVDAANPRPQNRHGHIVRWRETGDAPDATSFEWELFLLAGHPDLAEDNLKGNIVGDPFSSPDGIDVDPMGRLWVQTDASTGSSTTRVFGNNAMYAVDPQTKESRRFLVGPDGCEITGLTYTPDLKTFFINIQHPDSKPGAWPSNVQGNNLPGRSSTIVVRHKDGKIVGA